MMPQPTRTGDYLAVRGSTHPDRRIGIRSLGAFSLLDESEIE